MQDEPLQNANNTTSNQNKVQGAVTSISQSNIEIKEIGTGIFRATSLKSKYIIEYDINKCIGAASCAAIAPLTFFMNEENKAEIRPDVEDFDDDEVILAGAQSCPVFAIKIINKETGEILFPIDED